MTDLVRRSRPVGAGRLRAEPFRLFFPLGLLLGAAGVALWIPAASGALPIWPGQAHALLMTQGFLTALAVGFLGTMLPRRTGAAPLRGAEVGALAGALLGLPLASLAGSLALAELLFAAALAVLARYALRALRQRQGSRPPPPSFVWLPAALLFGLLGALLTAAGLWGRAPAAAIAIGRGLAQQGLMLGLVLGLAPMLSAILATGEGPPDPAPSRAARLRAIHLGGAAALLASFLLEPAAPSAGLLLRAAVCAAALSGALRQRLRRPGLHRRLFMLSLPLIPLGLAGAGLAPLHRVALLHLSFIGGLTLLSLAVSVHVGLLHTGHGALAERRPPVLAVSAGLLLAAMVLRAGADLAGVRYAAVLQAAAALWLSSALLWTAFLVPKLASRPRPEGRA